MMQLSGIGTLVSRSIKEGLKQSWRNRFLTGMTFVLAVVILFLVNVLFSVKFFIDYTLEGFEKRADFSVTLQEGFDSFQYEALINDVTKFDVSTQLLSQQSIGDFTVPQRLYIQFNEIEQVKDVMSVLKNNRYDTVVGAWDSVLEEEFVAVVEQLLLLKDFVHNFSWGLVIIFILSGILLTFNTFRITAFTRKDEIGIGRVVGAGKAFLIGPFVVEGVFIGFGASIVSIVAFVAVLAQLPFLPGGEIFEYLYYHVFYPEIIVSTLVAIVGAYLSLRKYLHGSFFGKRDA